MSQFKEIAKQILEEYQKPMHSAEITKIALGKGWLKTSGKTPEATMNAQLVVDINKKGPMSQFIKTAPSTFDLNPNFHLEVADSFIKTTVDSVELHKHRKAVLSISSKQKGDIAEARISELITLYGETRLSCFRPISDDEGIDIIVKPKGQFKAHFIQVKSRFGDNPSSSFTASVKASSLISDSSMSVVFCYFDTDIGDIWDYIWFVPAEDFVKLATKSHGGKLYRFVAGRTRREANKWDKYLIDKKDLADAVTHQIQI